MNFDDTSLTVRCDAGSPWIILQPASQAVVPGDSVTFQVIATGTKPFSYAWSFNGVPRAGATGQSLVIPNVQATDAGPYAVTVSNAEGAASSESATLTVLDRSGPVLVLDEIPAYGSQANLHGAALNAAPSLVKVGCAVGVPAIWSKPTFANPSVPVQADSSWAADVTTGGIDHLATRLYAWPSAPAPPAVASGAYG